MTRATMDRMDTRRHRSIDLSHPVVTWVATYPGPPGPEHNDNLTP